MNICVVTVTYGDRFYLLSKTIKAFIREGINKIILVDNNSSENTKKNLCHLENEFKGILKVIHLSENIGSAGAFKIGLQMAQNLDTVNFIWLMDDDNLPELGALNKLFEFWHSYPMQNKEEKLCLISNRIKKPIYKLMVQYNSKSISLILGRTNSFLGFNVLDFLSFPSQRICFSTSVNDDNILLKNGYGLVPVAPYGGMFFHKKLLDIIGFPDEKFYLYCDDFEFSHRIIEKGGEIILISDSKIIDIEDNLVSKKFEDDLYKFYYSTRNLIYWQKIHAKNKVTFKVNLYIFLLYKRIQFFLSFFTSNYTHKKLRVFFKAVNDAINEKMGKINEVT